MTRRLDATTTESKDDVSNMDQVLTIASSSAGGGLFLSLVALAVVTFKLYNRNVRVNAVVRERDTLVVGQASQAQEMGKVRAENVLLRRQL